MTLDEIQAKLTEAHALYVERVGKQPYGHPVLRIPTNGKANAFMWAESPADNIDGYGDTIEGALDGLLRAILNMPTGEEKALRDFQHDLAKLIDKGNATGIPVEFMNPVVETARKLAENIITDQRVPA